MSVMTPCTVDRPAVSTVSIEQMAQDAEDAEVKRLLSLVQLPVVRVFEHVSRNARIHGIRDFLPVAARERSSYDQMAYVRAMHKAGRLSGDDYALLARTPQVLGAAVYGAVEGAGEHWSWSFVPAGVDVSSVRFESEMAARADLRELQLLLYPAWHLSDNPQRTAYLRQLIHAREQRRRLSTLIGKPTLAFARSGLSKSVGMFVNDSYAGVSLSSASCGYYQGDPWAWRGSARICLVL